MQICALSCSAGNAAKRADFAVFGQVPAKVSDIFTMRQQTEQKATASEKSGRHYPQRPNATSLCKTGRNFHGLTSPKYSSQCFIIVSGHTSRVDPVLQNPVGGAQSGYNGYKGQKHHLTA
ncbi:TPA: hypothetical protein ACUKX0_001018 [Escherichia coli]